jgi:hypothetical protein
MGGHGARERRREQRGNIGSLKYVLMRFFGTFFKKRAPWWLSPIHWYISTLPQGDRYIGPRKDWYDGPIYCLGLWWAHIYVFRTKKPIPGGHPELVPTVTSLDPTSSMQDIIAHIVGFRGWTYSEISCLLGINTRLVARWGTGKRNGTEEQRQFLLSLPFRNHGGDDWLYEKLLDYRDRIANCKLAIANISELDILAPRKIARLQAQVNHLMSMEKNLQDLMSAHRP